MFHPRFKAEIHMLHLENLMINWQCMKWYDKYSYIIVNNNTGFILFSIFCWVCFPALNERLNFVSIVRAIVVCDPQNPFNPPSPNMLCPVLNDRATHTNEQKMKEIWINHWCGTRITLQMILSAEFMQLINISFMRRTAKISVEYAFRHRVRRMNNVGQCSSKIILWFQPSYADRCLKIAEVEAKHTHKWSLNERGIITRSSIYLYLLEVAKNTAMISCNERNDYKNRMKSIGFQTHTHTQLIQNTTKNRCWTKDKKIIMKNEQKKRRGRRIDWNKIFFGAFLKQNKTMLLQFIYL